MVRREGISYSRQIRLIDRLLLLFLLLPTKGSEVVRARSLLSCGIPELMVLAINSSRFVLLLLH